MIIDLRTFKQKGQFSGDFNFNFTADNQLLPTADYSFSESGVQVEGSFEIDGKDVYVWGKVSFTMNGPCSRCLENASSIISLEFDEKFVIFKDEECYTYSKDRVDLTEMVTNLILSCAPLCIYCKDDCLGLCPTCGANLNYEKCGCKN